jgi:hypothetical protein
VRNLVGLLPTITLEKVAVEKRAAGVWLITAWVSNQGFLPSPTHQGHRCGRPTPATVELSGGGITMLEGRPRKVCDLIAGSGGSQKFTWLVSAGAGTTVTVSAKTFSAGSAEQKIQLKEGGK